MDKLAVRVSGDRAFFDEVTTEAARLDRSPSWVLGHCLGAALPKIASSLVAAPAAKKKKKKADSAHTRTFFVPKDLLEDCGRLAARLGTSSDDVLAQAWQAGRDGVRAMPSS
jgi:hypothetical protein